MFHKSSHGAKRIHQILLCASVLWLTACGGGGGGGGAPATPTPTITAANQKAIAADAIDTAVDASIPLLAIDTMTHLQATPVAVADRRSGLALAARVLRSRALQAKASVLAASASQAMQCETGSGTLSGRLAGAGLVPGDTFTIEADHCRVTLDNVPVTTSGRLTMTVASGAFDPQNPAYQFVMDVEADHFAVETPKESDVATGRQRVEVAESGTGQGRMTATGDMTYTYTTEAGTHVSTLKNGTQAFAHDGDHVRLEASGSVGTSSPSLESVSYALATPVPLQWTGTHMEAGSLRVEGIRSALVITATGNATFRLELDDNGDGATEATSEAAETELGGLL